MWRQLPLAVPEGHVTVRFARPRDQNIINRQESCVRRACAAPDLGHRSGRSRSSHRHVSRWVVGPDPQVLEQRYRTQHRRAVMWAVAQGLFDLWSGRDAAGRERERRRAVRLLESRHGPFQRNEKTLLIVASQGLVPAAVVQQRRRAFLSWVKDSHAQPWHTGRVGTILALGGAAIEHNETAAAAILASQVVREAVGGRGKVLPDVARDIHSLEPVRVPSGLRTMQGLLRVFPHTLEAFFHRCGHRGVTRDAVGRALLCLVGI